MSDEVSVLSMNVRKFFGITAIFFFSNSAVACWNETAEKYGLSPSLLYAIAKTESNLNTRVINKNKNGSYDIGLMQINSSWLPTLRKYGIDEATLLDDYCVNLQVGAWILRQNVDRLGYNWDAVGAYNAASPVKRASYALKVYKNLHQTTTLTPALTMMTAEEQE